MLRDLINLSSVPLLDIEYLLDHAEKDARQFLQDSKFDEHTINICVDAWGSGRYARLFEEQHPLLFDEKYRWHTIVLQQISDIRHFLKSDDIPADEWVSHGYMLSYLQLCAYGPERYESVIASKNKLIAQGPRSKNPLKDKVLKQFRSEYEPPANSDIKCFGRFIGKHKVFDDLNIEVIEARNVSKRVIYKFKFPGSKHISETVTRDSIRKNLKKLAEKDKK